MSGALAELPATLQATESLAAADRLQQLMARGLDRLPQPGSGRTLQRWSALAAVARADLSLAKLYEGHTDALTIMAELGCDAALPPASGWGTWAAEAKGARVLIDAGTGGIVSLTGTKCWCSGAAFVSHGLLTAWWPDGRGPQLVAVRLDQPTISVDAGPWQAVGMADSASLDVRFAGATATLVGGVGDYLSRPGFWHGGAGIGACWFGGASGLADTLRNAVRGDPGAPFKRAALGRVEIALASALSVLRDAAAAIDERPHANARELAMRVRLVCEASATLVLAEVGRALGAGPFCKNRRFARAAADLPVFMRQSHAEHDLAALGDCVAEDEAERWLL